MGFLNTVAEYIWLGGKDEFRSKTRVFEGEIRLLEQLPKWNYDGSSTDQAQGTDSEVILVPRQVFPDPIRGGNSILVWCETMRPDESYLHNSHRHWANDIFEQNKDAEPWFGLEQEYFMINPVTMLPIGFPDNNENALQGQYYCSVGANNTFGRSIYELHSVFTRQIIGFESIMYH